MDLKNVLKNIDTSKLCTTFRSITTVNGYPFDIMKSALQKYIRRGEFYKALYSANEMNVFIFFPEGKAAYTNFINRIRVIVLEDIGIASPHLVITVNNLLKKLLDNNSNNNSNNNSFTSLHEIISSMANNLHYRFYSHIRSYTKNLKIDMKAKENSFPLGKDIAFKEDVSFLIQCLEKKDITAIRWILNFFNSEEKLLTKRYKSNHPKFLAMNVVEWFFTLKNVSPIIIDIFKVCLDWLKTLKVQEAFLCIAHPVYVYILEEHLNFDLEPHISPVRENYLSSILNLKNERILLDSFVIDKHTKEGRKNLKNTADFAVEGSLVAFEDSYLQKKIESKIKFSELYIRNRINGENLLKETEVFTFKVRAQLTCSLSRPDVYYAFENKENVVVKGPYLTFEAANRVYQISNLIKLFPKVNNIDINVKMLYPDMFEKVPIGIRNKTNKDTPCYFVIMKDMFNQDDYPTEIKSSKCWPETKVVNYSKLFSNQEMSFASPDTLTEEGNLSLIYQLAWRYVFEIGDFAQRNIIQIQNKVYNIDAEDVFVGNAIRWKKSDRKIIADFFRERKEKITKVLKGWLKNRYRNLYYDRWFMVKRILNLTDEQVIKIRNNIEYLIESFEEWIFN